MNTIKTLIALALLIVVSSPIQSLQAQDANGEPGRNLDGPNPLKNVYFGEQHLHSESSADAFAIGCRQKPEDAYRYAMGEKIILSTTKEKIKKATPYDFVALTDHAEYLGVFPELIDPKNPLSKSDFAKSLKLPRSDPKSAFNQYLESAKTNTPIKKFVTSEVLTSNWQKHVENANKYNKPGKFTTIIAFEWTSTPDNQNMHRNVFFKDNGPQAPFSSYDSVYPEDLWTYLEVQRDLGHECLAIPHNGNISNGLMYAPETMRGVKIDEIYAKRRQINEPLTEIIQVKGQSETHPTLSPNDEFADFEIFPNLLDSTTPSKIKYGFVRQALVDGLLYEQKLGTNPFKHGIVSGADIHSGYSGNEEFNWHGAHAELDDTIKKRLSPSPSLSGLPASIVGTAGATAVWAEENTRESIFEAMERRETYGTSGPLIRLRFFGGWEYPLDIINSQDFIKNAYEKGVPMGGDMPEKPVSSKAPVFAVWALKDPQSGNLDRIQIIKGWTENGEAKEKIFNVALSDERKPDPKTGVIPPVGNTVDIKNASYTNDIGDTQLAMVWQDPEFNADEYAVYYVRILEIPTPRWSTYDAAKSGVDPPKGVPATIQERAWSSPIWYTPNPKKAK